MTEIVFAPHVVTNLLVPPHLCFKPNVNQIKITECIEIKNVHANFLLLLSKKVNNLFYNYPQNDDNILMTLCITGIYVAFITAKLSHVYPSVIQENPNVILVLGGYIILSKMHKQEYKHH